eukprot:CAMPEP_0179289282 /NCGR_PEP_ID=MMETSP0797-20121207/41218_1 /TAXON_ID=47934 /ORGANISM="Dinophysis acuminata, Strain DAEP01" /LENGTH=232 /DNA_ID=CAMNT_0020998275 /DNA_START=54 /DNA_END=750 /DNA_ORIENTATION=-
MRTRACREHGARAWQYGGLHMEDPVGGLGRPHLSGHARRQHHVSARQIKSAYFIILHASSRCSSYMHDVPSSPSFSGAPLLFVAMNRDASVWWKTTASQSCTALFAGVQQWATRSVAAGTPHQALALSCSCTSASSFPTKPTNTSVTGAHAVGRPPAVDGGELVARRHPGPRRGPALLDGGDHDAPQPGAAEARYVGGGVLALAVVHQPGLHPVDALPREPAVVRLVVLQPV